eukprot:m.209650 g.209650  ORF g.209650 m.209650 type:complete len:65 (+) comp15047_c0_seq14:273-467(+)
MIITSSAIIVHSSQQQTVISAPNLCNSKQADTPFRVKITKVSKASQEEESTNKQPDDNVNRKYC